MLEKKYNSIHDFLEDDSFKNWAFDHRLSDVSFWNYWIENNPDKKHLAFEAKDILLGINFNTEYKVSEEKIDFEWNKLVSKLENKQEISDKKSTSKKRWFINIGIAASIAMLLFSALFVYDNFSNTTHKTNFGEILEIKLNDGTFVTLNSNSSLTYKKNEPRKIWLKGEAYFSVHKQETSNAKFWVNTNDLIVEVYGTKFNVNTFQKKTTVFLEEGNIWLSLSNGTSKKMIPNNYVEYSSIRKKVLIDNDFVSKDEQISWKNGKLIFNSYTLEEALNKVSNTYDVTFQYIDSEIKNTLITGIVPTTNLDICLSAIKKSTNVNFKKKNNLFLVDKTN